MRARPSGRVALQKTTEGGDMQNRFYSTKRSPKAVALRLAIFALAIAPGGLNAQLTWTRLTNTSPIGAGTSLLLTDGTVLVHQSCGSAWYRLTPDSSGSYINGTWSAAASLPAGYAPLYFASAVLADGRLIVMGGEYNNSTGSTCAFSFTNRGAIYNPVTNVWT